MPKFYSVRKAGPGIGAGMYHAIGGLCECATYRTGTRHPMPWSDTALRWDHLRNILGVPKDHCYFGFSSLDQLKSWLYRQEWREYLHENGFVVKAWELPEESMHSGNAQAVATKQALESHEPAYISVLDLEPMDIEF